MPERPAPRAISLVFVAGLSACFCFVFSCNGSDGSGGEGALPGSAGAPVSPSGSADAGPRRPLRRYYMGKTKERCEVYTVEEDVIEPRGEAPCPAYIEVGERIRLAGFTCLREGLPARTQPVVCPGPLLLAERDDRAARELADAGPDGSASASASASAPKPGPKPAPKKPK